MLLDGCTLFPHHLLPLFIFEPRYREMLRHALETHRMFCIGNRRTAVGTAGEADDGIVDFSTAGMVRACVQHADGTSHLVLQGISRIRLLGWEQRLPFRIARVEPVPSIPGDRQENQLLAGRLMEIAAQLLSQSATAATAEISSQLRTLRNPETLADFMAANFLQDGARRQRLLATQHVGQRLRRLLDWLGPRAGG